VPLNIQILPSPTTGAFVAQSFNWKSSSGGNQQIVKEEDKSFSNFSFQTRSGPPASSTATYQSSNVTVQTVCDQFQCIDSFSLKQSLCFSLCVFLHDKFSFSKFLKLTPCNSNSHGVFRRPRNRIIFPQERV